MTQHYATLISALVALSLTACDAEGQGAPDEKPPLGAEPVAGALEAGAEAGTEAGAEAEAGAEGGAQLSPSCEPGSIQNQDLLPELRSTQIHPDAVWDGEAFWVTWTLPNDESKFEIWAGRFACDMSPLVAPFALDQSPGMNDTDSVVAVQGDQVLIAWMRDNSFMGGEEYNLSTLTQRLDRVSGERLGELSTLALTIEGSPREGNLWMPDLSASPEGGYVVVGAWGNPEVNSFQVVMIPLNEEGVAGEGWLVEPEGRDQINPVVSRYGQTFDVLWSGKGAEDAEGFWVKTWRVSEGAWSSDELIDLSGREWVSASVGRGLKGTYRDASTPSSEAQRGAPYLIGSKSNGSLELITPDGTRGSAGISGQSHLGPALGYGVIASYERISGNQNKVWWRGVSAEGSLQPEAYFMQDGPAAPYPLSITPFPGGHLALWAQGYNPEFMLKATLF